MPVEMWRGPLGGGSVAAQVYFVGIGETSENEVLESKSDGGGPLRGPGRDCWAASNPHEANENAATATIRVSVVFICISLPKLHASIAARRLIGYF